MKHFLHFFIFLICLNLSAKQINSTTASSLARSFIERSPSLTKRKAISLNLVYTSKKDNKTNTKTIGSPYSFYYVFNIGNNEGFVIVSADDVNTPIIGYSNTGSYDPNHLPDNFKDWMDKVALGMEKAILEKASPSKEVQAEWENLRKGKSLHPQTYKTIVVEPLIKTQWNQSAPYNSQIPYPGMLTGCVATATAQIMNYYKYPKSGIGITEAYMLSNDNTTYNIPTIDLSKYTYDWPNMLNTYNYITPGNEAQKKAVGLLMYHIGASIKMNYSKSASSASSWDAAHSLLTHFDYDKSLDLISRYNYSNDAWDEMLRNELNNKRPVYYEGWRQNAGHAFICDGYDDEGFFHFNWGWGGNSDGYFKTTAPLNYTANQSAIINIKPNAGTIGLPKLELEEITPEVTSGKSGTIFPVNFKFQNISLYTFKGYYGIALTDDNDNIKYILYQSYYISELNPNYYWKTSASCIIPQDAIAGKYRLRLIAKSAEQNNWFIVNSAVKYVSFEVLNGIEPVKLQLLSNTPLSVSKNSVTTGEEEMVNVKVSFGNYSGLSFRGYYGIALTDNTNSIKYILAQSGLSQLDYRYYYPEYNFYFYVPSNAIAGDYTLRMVSKKEENDAPWTVVDGKSSSVIDRLPFKIINPAKMKMAVSDQISTYPNPVTDQLYIQSAGKITKVILYNMSGTIALQANENELKNKAISLVSLSPGVYIVHIYTEQEKTVQNIIKK